MKKSQQIYDMLLEYYHARVCDPIRYNVRLSEAPGQGKSIFEYDSRSAGAEDYASLVERILDDDV